ncbi:MAG: hypothetical protein NVS4B9_27530 [Ktedonobacteraceae bacterium]
MEPDAPSAISLVEYGLNHIQQGRYAEGAIFFRQARERLFPAQAQLIATLDALSKATSHYLHAQQTLHEASKYFAEADIEQQAQIAALKKLLPDLEENTDIASFTRVQARKSSKGQQAFQVVRPFQYAAENAKEYELTRLLENESTLPSLYITCFGRFEVRRLQLHEQPLTLCSNLKGQAVLRYLIAQPKHRETVDRLTAVLWADNAPEVARHKLRVAISALRCSLNKDCVNEAGGGYILCKDQSYQLNPSVVLRSDIDEFLALYQAGQQAGSNATEYYEKACRLYSGPFLVEDLYADWSFIRREELSKIYVAMCDKLARFNLEHGCYKDAAKWALAILKVDQCDEEAHQQLMRAYAADGRRSEALRQYQYCQRVLSEELGVQPMPDTQNLLHMLLNGEDFAAMKRK